MDWNAMKQPDAAMQRIELHCIVQYVHIYAHTYLHAYMRDAHTYICTYICLMH